VCVVHYVDTNRETVASEAPGQSPGRTSKNTSLLRLTRPRTRQPPATVFIAPPLPTHTHVKPRYMLYTYVTLCARRMETEVQNSRRPLRGDNNNPFQTFARAERLTSKPTVTSKQRRRQLLFNVQSNKRAGGGARTHNYFSSSPVTANTPQIDCFGGRKLYARSHGVCALSCKTCARVVRRSFV